MKEKTRRFYEEVFNQHNADAADEFIATDAVSHATPPGMPNGLEGAKQLFRMYFVAFPDLHFSVENIIAEGDKVVARYTMSGTHKGELMGIPATGKTIAITGIDILRIAEDKIIEHWGISDELGMMQQLGVIPAPGGPEK